MDGPDAAALGAAPGLLRGDAPPPRRPVLTLVALSAVVSVVFLAFMLAATQGTFVPQVVDVYLVCQYARAIVDGHPFRYNPGELPSTGATSLLYTVGLALPEALGIRGEGLIAFAIVVGATFYAASVLLARAVATRLAGAREGMLAGLLVAFGGPVVWSFLYGSDIALFLLLALWLLERWLASADAGVPLWTAPGVLLALARPEGLPIALALAVAWMRLSEREASPRRDLRPWLPVAAGLAVLVLYRLLTGSWLGTSVEDKSLFASYGLNQGLAIASEYGVDVIRGLLLGLYPSQVPIGLARGWASLFFPPLALAAVAVAAIVPARALRRATAAWLAMVAVLFALVTPSVFIGAQFQRYLLWAFPGLLALAAAGLGHATTWAIRDPRRERAAFRGVALLWIALGALSTLRFAALYGEFAGDVYRRDVAAAQWIRRNIPPGTRMANLATSVEYLTGHHNLNLHGVTTPAFFGDHAAEREADAFEGLRRLPPAERPAFLITSVLAQDRFPVMRELVSGPALLRTASFADEIEIYPMRYELLERGREPAGPETLAAVRGLTEVDRLNVCDSREEAAHEYSFVSSAGAAPVWGTARIDAYPDSNVPIADGGRAILGGESFRIAARPGRELLMVLRTAPAIDASLLQTSGPRRVGVEFPEAAFTVSVDGQAMGRASFHTRPGWNEVVIRITGNLVHGERPRLELAGRYASFQYWFFQ
ncbi:MAG TPA: hypothetical protein VIK51_05535 [Vicinamibacteria bacterium]